MSKAVYWQRGEALDYTNAGTEVIEENTVITFGSRIGVIGCNIAPGATEPGSLHVKGVFSIPKASEAITAGAEVYFSESTGKITSTATNNVLAGYAVAAATKDDAEVLVSINA